MKHTSFKLFLLTTAAVTVICVSARNISPEANLRGERSVTKSPLSRTLGITTTKFNAGTTNDIDVRGAVYYTESDSVTYGINRLPMSADEAFVAIAADVNASYGGVEIEGKYYAVYRLVLYGMYYYYMVDVYDSSTWELLAYYQLDDRKLFASDVAYDSTTDRVYGCFWNDAADGYVFGYCDYETLERTAICDLETQLLGIAADTDGTIYAIDRNGYLCTVDKETGAQVQIGHTGLSPYYNTSATIDTASGRLFFTYMPSDGTGWLYEIDKTTATATVLTQFSGNEEVTGIYVPTPVAEDDAPAAVDKLAVDFEGGSLVGTVSFTAPTTTYGGSTASGNIDYTVIANGKTVATGTTAFGAVTTADVELVKADNYKFTVYVTNSAGDSPRSRVYSYIGYDQPTQPESVSANWADNNFTVAWNAVTTTVNGGYIDTTAVTYSVMRYPDSVAVATSVKETTITDPVTESEQLTNYYYAVVAHSDVLTSDAACSDTVTVGYIIPPYFEDFETAETFEYFKVIDGNADGYTWGYIDAGTGGKARYMHPNAESNDDWLVLPKLKLEGGNAYRLAFCVYGSYGFTEKMEVATGRGNTASDLTTTLIEPFEITSRASNPDSLVVYICANDDGYYYVGFHAISDTENSIDIYLDNITIDQGRDATVPATVTCITITPGTEGACTADISFKAPTTDFAGNAISELSKIEVSRDSTVIKTFESPEPGSSLAFTDEVTVMGEYTYSFVAYNASGAGDAITESTYIGIMRPAAVSAFEADETTTYGEVTFTWSEVTTDNSGSSLASKYITYRIYENIGGNLTLVADSLTGTTYTYQAVESTAEQTAKKWTIYSVTAGGTSYTGMTTSAISLGAPYSLPFVESFTGGEATYVFTTDVVSGSGSWDVYTDDNYYSFLYMLSSIDNDNGYAGMISSTKNSRVGFVTGKIVIDGTAPALSFNIHHLDAIYSDPYYIYAKEVGGDWELVKFQSQTNYGVVNDWFNITVDLSDYIGKTIRLRIVATYTTYAGQFIDKIYIGDILDNNLTATIDAPESALANEPFEIGVTVDNIGATTASGYSVDIYRDGSLVTTTQGDDIAVARVTEIAFTDTLSVMDNEVVEYFAVVRYDSDGDTTDNTTATAQVALILPDYPTVTDLDGQRTNLGATLIWAAPDLTSYNATADSALIIEGYNVYRNRSLLSASPSVETTHTDAGYTGSDDVYAVTVVYNLGESAPSVSITVDESGIAGTMTADITISAADGRIIIAGAEGKSIGIYTIDGSTIFAGIASYSVSVGVPPGVYIVRVGIFVRKIAVR